MDQETSEDKLFTKARQIARHLQTDSLTAARQIAVYWGLMRLDRYYLLRYLSRLQEFRFFRSDFRPILMYLCRVSFLTILNIYKTYFRGLHIREYKENICERWPMPYSLWKKLLCLCALGFCNQVLLDLHCWWSEELCSQQSSSSWCVSHVLGAMHHWLVTYWDMCKKGGVHILKSLEVLKR